MAVALGRIGFASVSGDSSVLLYTSYISYEVFAQTEAGELACVFGNGVTDMFVSASQSSGWSGYLGRPLARFARRWFLTRDVRTKVNAAQTAHKYTATLNLAHLSVYCLPKRSGYGSPSLN